MTHVQAKKISKNTAFLYVRMLVIMAVTFYTSRVILKALGEVDYGIYSVVGGVVSMLTFLSGSLAAATSRFLTYELGRGDFKSLCDTFSVSLNLHILVAVLIIIIGESVGLWFLYHKMTIPDSRMHAAFWIFQFSIVITCIRLIQVPYNASIISHENMAIYAYIGLYEAFSTLAISYLIQLNHHGRLVLYGFLMMLNVVIVQGFYNAYTRRMYAECRMRWIRDKNQYKRLLGYSGWNMFGLVAGIVQSQGINIVLNLFFGPVINAAREIAAQIQSGLRAFVTNFLTAVRPRVVRMFAERRYDTMYRLTFIACKISYFLTFAIVLPLAFELNFVLGIWLGNTIPAYTNLFAWIMLGIVLTDSFHSAYLMAFHAIGKMREGNLLCGSLMISALPIGYCLLKAGCAPYSVFIVILVINLICHVISWGIVHRYIRFSILRLVKTVYLPCLLVSTGALVAPVILVTVLDDGWCRFLLVGIVAETVYLTLVLLVGFDEEEKKQLVYPFVRTVKAKFRHALSF